MTGEVRKLPKAIAVMKKKIIEASETESVSVPPSGDALEIVEIIEWQVVFSSRPEPVGE